MGSMSTIGKSTKFSNSTQETKTQINQEINAVRDMSLMNAKNGISKNSKIQVTVVSSGITKSKLSSFKRTLEIKKESEVEHELNLEDHQ